MQNKENDRSQSKKNSKSVRARAKKGDSKGGSADA